MKASPLVLDRIRNFEGMRLLAYVCPAGKLTIGYGHTGPDVSVGQVINAAKANELFMADVKECEEGLSAAVRVKLTQGQFDSLMSFVFNFGLGNLRASMLLKKLNSADYEGARKEFARWNHIKKNGKMVESPGLTGRRRWETENFV